MAVSPRPGEVEHLPRAGRQVDRGVAAVGLEEQHALLTQGDQQPGPGLPAVQQLAADLQQFRVLLRGFMPVGVVDAAADRGERLRAVRLDGRGPAPGQRVAGVGVHRQHDARVRGPGEEGIREGLVEEALAVVLQDHGVKPGQARPVKQIERAGVNRR